MEYGNLKTAEGVYIPKDPKSYPTDDPHKHLVVVKKPKKSKDFKFDDSYPYRDRSFNYWLHRNIIGWLFLHIIVYLANRLKHGLKIEGRKNLKGWEKELGKGAIAVCNHVYQFDAVAVKQALSPLKHIWIPMYARHFNGGQYWFVRYVGGVPVPETMSGLRKFDEAFDYYHNEKKALILVFPEEVRWDHYVPIRPFKKGAFTMAYKYDAPVVPCVLTYRERKGIYKLFGKADAPCFTIHVGTPIMPDRSHTRKEEVDRLRVESHKQMEQMAGIEENPWPAIGE